MKKQFLALMAVEMFAAVAPLRAEVIIFTNGSNYQLTGGNLVPTNSLSGNVIVVNSSNFAAQSTAVYGGRTTGTGDVG